LFFNPSCSKLKLQEELNDLNINEEAFLEAKGLGANYFKPAKVHQKDLKMLENGNNSTARVRTASSRKAIKGNPSPMHEICESLKGPRVPKVKESPKSARTSEDDLKTNSNKSNLSLKRPATTQSVRVSPFLSENFKLQDEMSRKKSNAQWFQEHRSKVMADNRIWFHFHFQYLYSTEYKFLKFLSWLIQRQAVNQ